jgi:hypothetical protein
LLVFKRLDRGLQALDLAPDLLQTPVKRVHLGARRHVHCAQRLVDQHGAVALQLHQAVDETPVDLHVMVASDVFYIRLLGTIHPQIVHLAQRFNRFILGNPHFQALS